MVWKYIQSDQHLCYRFYHQTLILTWLWIKPKFELYDHLEFHSFYLGKERSWFIVNCTKLQQEVNLAWRWLRSVFRFNFKFSSVPFWLTFGSHASFNIHRTKTEWINANFSAVQCKIAVALPLWRKKLTNASRWVHFLLLVLREHKQLKQHFQESNASVNTHRSTVRQSEKRNPSWRQRKNNKVQS